MEKSWYRVGRSAQALLACANGQQNHNFVALGRRQPLPISMEPTNATK